MPLFRSGCARGLSQPYPYGAAGLRGRRISLFRLSAAAAGRGAARDALCAARADREPLARAHGDGCPLSGRTWRIPCALSRCGAAAADAVATSIWRSEEHTSELQSLMRISYAVFCLKKKKKKRQTTTKIQ